MPHQLSPYIKNIKNYSVTDKLKKAIYLFIVKQILSSDMISIISEAFKVLDSHGYGLLSPLELKKGIEDYLGENDFDVENLLSKIDENKNKVVDYYEFLVAGID